MCGIAGIISFDKKSPEKERVTTMLKEIKHRGPNDEGSFFENNVGLGFVRLSIIDLSIAGHQPMIDETGRYVVTYNGEIYNYIELRNELVSKGLTFTTNSDTEVLLKSYITYGEECLNKFNGMFAFVIYDRKTKEIFGARDRFGVKPFYYYYDHNEFIYSSEIPAILSVYNKKNEPNSQAIFDYLVFNRTDQTDNTFFKGIKKIQHGHCFKITSDNQFYVWKWYDLRNHITSRISNNPVEDYRKLLIDSVSLRLRSDVPVGVCLSGGLDSSSVVSIIAHYLGNKDINTFSAVYGSDKKSDESKFIDLYKNELDYMYRVVPTGESLFNDIEAFIRMHSEPMPSTGPYAQYNVMRMAKDHVTVTLDGQGADEELAGYHYFYGLYFKDLLKHFKLCTLIKEIFYYLKLHKSLYGLKTFFYFLLPSSLRTKVRVDERGYICEDFVKKSKPSVISDSLYGSESLTDALINHFDYKLEHLLKWNDRNSMAFSIESRTPFLDYRLVEYTLSLSNNYKIRNGYTKAVLREALKNVLPEQIRLRKDKIGFSTPQDDWFREPKFKDFINVLLDSQQFAKRGIIDPTKAKELFKRHCNKEINISKDIWKWINLELWYRFYID